MTIPIIPKYYTIKETAIILRASPAKLYEMINSGKIGFFKCEGSFLISEGVLKGYIDRNIFRSKRIHKF